MLKDTVKRWFGFPTVADYQKQLIAKLEEIEGTSQEGTSQEGTSQEGTSQEEG
jgi:hypothetical protein